MRLRHNVLVERINNEEELEKLIIQESLIEIAPSIRGTENVSFPISSYFGVGLCNGGKQPTLSKGMPIDILSMILVNELISQEKYILIADTHAKTNGFNDIDISRIVLQYQKALETTLENLGFRNWQILISSDFDNSKEYKAIFDSFHDHNEYVRRELTDIMWFKQEKEVNLKLGWALKGSKTDEVAFDNKFREVFGNGMNFLYTTPGKTFNPRQLRTAPYFCADPEARILLNRYENVISKISSAEERFGKNTNKCYKKFLKNIVRLYDRVVERTEKAPIEYKVQQIIEGCTK